MLALMCFMLALQAQTTRTSYLYQYHRKNNIADVNPTVQSAEEADDAKYNNCRHVKLNIHIGQFVINETILDSVRPDPEPMVFDNQQ